MEVKESWKICPECGRRLMCATCSRRIPAGQSECPACRNNQAGRQEDTGVYIEPVTNMEFVFVPAGTFEMGDLYGDGWDNGLPLREEGVESFYLAKYPATQDPWGKVMGVNPSKFRKGVMYPVEQVTWADVDEFIRRLNALTSGGKPFRLPWERREKFSMQYL